MRFHAKITAAAMSVSALTMGFFTAAVPAASAVVHKSNPRPAGEVAAAWTRTTTPSSAPIRECYASSCDVVIRTDPGSWVYWSHYAYNSSGNRWYYVRYTAGNGTPHDFYGWVYCGNVTAPC
ncbi:hypothetical protein SAMN05428945_4080 [Streptomyces sp. 2224.1]|uniref:hypothetical protein n=1 Tax=unclassified Streptomyces TaxID=2593676 RepID=UPI00088EB3C3|nr:MULTISPECIES: hypothetical protein [unclassified Streptomyces]PBC81383.1 hypothetical protein BX261_1257 [Streptomyces sp. 2321.6]SDR55281.1 hypothetical protein SAMN05216511_5959 [Streptomyces sp. KS_16]SEC12922.1 hypothetical protein SAMN05428940_1256 [Streptomyces sp. 2133.1]SED17773.1 hypothetical protein SAMN05428945_4080 [Streptomyces sp. 2224.1]SEF08317.1 hypothetical protein SAMN05428954_6022 [Streptomyces sp. 2112.3]